MPTMPTMPSSPDTFTWLHLTDLHFGLKGQAALWPNQREAFHKDLASMLAKTGRIDAVLFTGDLVQQGKPKEFADMQREVLDRLWQILAQHGSGDAVLLAVPGNHDLSRPKLTVANRPVLKLLFAADRFGEIASDFWGSPKSPYRKVLEKAFANYNDWWQTAPRRASDIKQGIIPGDFACTLPCGTRKIGIIGLNTAFLQLDGGNYHGKLVWDVRQLHAVCGDAVDDWVSQHDVCLLLTHQGPDWLAQDALKHGKREIARAGRFAVHLFGHMHENNLSSISTGGNPAMVRQWQAASLFGMEKYGEPPTEFRSHGYAIGQIRFAADQAQLRMWPRRVANDPSGWRFVADVDNAVTGEDDGTTPEPVPVRQCAPAPAPVSTMDAEKSPVSPPAVAPPDHPQQKALHKLEEKLALAWQEPAAQPFLQALCRDLAVHDSTNQTMLLAALDVLPGGLPKQAHAIKRALARQTLPQAGSKPHAIERVAAHLYFRAAILAVNIAQIESLCANAPELTEVFHGSAAMVAVLMAVLRAENHELDWANAPVTRSNPGQRIKGKTLLNVDHMPPDPLQQVAALTKEALGQLDPAFGFDPDALPNPDQLQKMQQHVKRRVEHQLETYDRPYRFVVSDPASRLYQDNAYVAELFASLGMPLTRIVPRAAAEVESILGVSPEYFDDLFVQFLEVLRDAKQAGGSPTP